MSDPFLVELQTAFLGEATELLEQTEEKFIALEKDPENKEILNAIFRFAHNLKGTGRAVGLDDLANFAHRFENLLVKLKNGEKIATPEIIDLLLKCNDRFKSIIQTLKMDLSAKLNNDDLIKLVDEAIAGKQEAPIVEVEDIGTILKREAGISQTDIDQAVKLQNSKLGEILVEQGKVSLEVVSEALKEQQKQKEALGVKSDDFIKVPLSKIDNLLNNFGEQVILQSTLDHAKMDLSHHHDIAVKTIGQLNKITYDLQRTAISLRMVSIKNIYTKMERIVRDTSKSLGKKIEFIKMGEETEIDKTIADAISDPLTHMIRNSVDHGIESAADRIKAGKSEVGHVTLHSHHKGGFLYIEIKDDGKGLDKEKIRAKGIKQGLIKEGENLSDKQLYDLIFVNGFSVKEVTTDLSGRGVGMDVVKQAVLKLKGSCEIDTKLNVGTTFIIKLPLTLAVFNGMITKVANEKYVIPNSDVEEIIKLLPEHQRKINPKEKIIELHNEVMPLIDLRDALKKSQIPVRGESKSLHQLLLVTRYNNRKIALVVDEILQQQRIVHKNLGTELENLSGISGGTILSDGRVSLILEIPEIINNWTKSV